MPAADLDPRLQGLSPAKRKLLFERLLDKAAQREPEPLVPVPRDSDLPCSFGQKQLWLIDQLDPGTPAYNIPAVLALDGDLDAGALASGLAAAVARHEPLRTRFAPAGEEPRQVIETQAAVGMPRIDLSSLPAGLRQAESGRLAAVEELRPFDLECGPVLRAALLRLAPRRHVLLLTLHHIAGDGWSMGVLMSDLAALYEARLAGRPAALPELPVQYADWAWHQRRRLRGERLEALAGWWREVLTPPPPPLELPFDRPRTTTASGRGGRLSRALPTHLPAALGSFAKARGATLFTVLLAAFQVLLSRLTGQEDFGIGTPVANRERPETERLVGYFVNTLVLRAGLAGDPTFGEALERTRRAAAEAWSRAEMPFDLLVETLRPERDPAVTPFFQVMFALQNAPLPRLELPGLTLTPLEPSREGAAQFDLTLSVIDEGDGRLTATAVYGSDLFDGTTVQRLLDRYLTLLEAAAASPDLRLSDLPLLQGAERQQVLVEWNDTDAERSPRLLHDLFFEQAGRTPDAVAAETGDEALTYGEMARRARQLASRLRAQGVGPEVPVGIAMERSLERIVALLAVLQAGGACLPLDPESPPERLRLLLDDAAPALVLTGSETGPAMAATEAGTGPDNLAFVFYTSGSTGRPKGVQVTHRGLVNRLLWAQRTYPLNPSDRVLQKAPFHFDFSVWEAFGPLLAGARAVLARPGGERDGAYLAQTLVEREVTVVHFVPSLLRVFLEEEGLERCATLRLAFSGGEALPRELQERFTARLSVPLRNQYGPTEVSIDTADWPCPPEETRGGIPIGRPIGNARLHLLDRGLQPVPVGAAGELCVAGEGVARGYLGRPDLTAGRFLPDPFSGLGTTPAGGRLYRTGDLARHRTDGALEFLGRIDHQVKVRGFRIEPEEVEAALAAHPAVRECAVAARVEPSGDARLLAWVVPEPGRELTLVDLRTWLQERLPPHMVPAAFTLLQELPLTPSGKLDRRALLQGGVSSDQLRGAAYEAPHTPTEERLAAIWRDLLKADRVGIHDSFFELGGDSILCLRVVLRAREEGIILTPAQVFRLPTISQLAKELETTENLPEETGPAPADAEPGAFPDADLSARDLEKLLARLGGREP